MHRIPDAALGHHTTVFFPDEQDHATQLIDSWMGVTPMAYWLLKTEPNEYSYDDLERAGRDMWDGVRNHLAQKHLRTMQQGDQALIYHTGDERATVGMAEVVSSPFPDPTDTTGRFHAVDIVPIGRLQRPIPLAEVKQFPALSQWELVRLPRLSVVPVPPAIWQWLLQLAASYHNCPAPLPSPILVPADTHSSSIHFSPR